VLTVILHDLLRVVTDNYEKFKSVFRIAAVYYGKLRFIEAF